MTILRFFRRKPRADHCAERAEISRILNRGPHDSPAGLREMSNYARSLDGRW